jgi:acyl-CoA thioesterase
MPADQFPFAGYLGLHIVERGEGTSTLSVDLQAHHMNSLGGAHGSVLFALADTGMGAALYTLLEPAQTCVTIEVKINYFKSVSEGTITCRSAVVHKGRSVANIEASLYSADVLVARANGSFSIQRRGADRDTDSNNG